MLVWAVRLDEVGHVPTRRELRMVAEPRRRPGDRVVTALSGQDAEFSEGAITSLIRRGLLREVDDRGVGPTELGRRAVAAAELDGGLPALFEVIDADLRSGDPLAFARVVGRIAALHRPMVVDPYCGRAELEYLAAHTSVSRVLVSDRLGEDELADLVDAVRSIRTRDVKLRLRVGPAAELRDRCVVGERILQVGGLPGVGGGGATVLVEVYDAADAVREHYGRLWRSAERLAVYKPSRGSVAAA